MSAVSVLELDGAGAGSKREELVAETDAHDRDLRRFHQFAEVVDGSLAMGWIARAVGDEDSVEVVGHFVDGVVVGEGCDAGATADEAAEDVFFDAAVDDGDVEVAGTGADVEGGFGADLADEVDLFGVDEGLVLIGVVLFADRDASERGTLLAEIRHNGAGVDAGNGGHSLPSTPGTEAFDGCPVTVLFCHVCHDNTRGLNIGRFEIFQQPMLITSG